MTFSRIAISAAVIASVLVVPELAFADVLPPDATDCQSKATGASCMTAAGESGVCEPQDQPGSPLCTQQAMDAGTDAAACNKTIEVCSAAADGGSTMTGGTDGGSKGATDGGTTTSSGNGSSKSGGCSTTGMSAGDVARAGAPFLLAALVPLALRKRKRKNDDA